MWQQADQPITLLLAGTQIIASLKNGDLVPQNALLEDGECVSERTHYPDQNPFVAQQDFDKLLILPTAAA